MSMAYAAINKSIEDLGNTIRKSSNRDFEDMDCLSKEICKTQIYIIESFEHRRQNNTLLSVKSSELKEDELTTSHTTNSVPLPHIHLCSLPTNDITSWTIRQEQDKM